MTARNTLTLLQCATFVGLAIALLLDGAPRLAAAQLLLGIITWLIYA